MEKYWWFLFGGLIGGLVVYRSLKDLREEINEELKKLRAHDA